MNIYLQTTVVQKLYTALVLHSLASYRIVFIALHLAQKNVVGQWRVLGCSLPCAGILQKSFAISVCSWPGQWITLLLQEGQEPGLFLLLCFFHCVFPKICLTILNWMMLLDGFWSFWSISMSFLSILLVKYVLCSYSGTKRSVRIWFGCLDIVKSLTLFNDAAGWTSVILVYLHQFLVDSCSSFICLLFSMYCVGTMGRKRSVWIWFGCVDIVKSLTARSTTPLVCSPEYMQCNLPV